MATRTRIPSLLEPYLRLPPETSLLLLTSTLTCSINWITARLASRILAPLTEPGVNIPPPPDDTAVVLVSWMRGADFWTSEIKRTTHKGLDPSRQIQSKRLVLVDFLNSLPDRNSDTIKATEQRIQSALSLAGDRKTVLVLDNPDLLLAINACTASQLGLLLLRLREAVHATVVACVADDPMVSAAATETGVEGRSLAPSIATATAAFVVEQAHSASLILSTRELATGAARDVSGVLSITGGGGDWGDDVGGDQMERDWASPKDLELLYLVRTDGSAEVFRRGAGPAT